MKAIAMIKQVSRVRNRVGERYGRLVALRLVGLRYGAVWECRCDCGTIKQVPGSKLTTGAVRSCGCLRREFVRPNTTHGMSDSVEYRIWQGMLNRCRNRKMTNYHRYGGRGIEVCERWRNSFRAFMSDMGPRPSDSHSIDRVNVNGNYEPENCRWATHVQQARNRSTARLLTHGGKTLCLEDWAKQLGTRSSVLCSRLERGWSVEEAVTVKPVVVERLIPFRGKQLPVGTVERMLGTTPGLIRYRLVRSWSVVDAITTPPHLGNCKLRLYK